MTKYFSKRDNTSAITGSSLVLLRKQLESREQKKKYFLSLKKGVWVYFLLLLLEGSLRKWVLPSLSIPLLIVRDPVALWLIIKAWQKGVIPSNPYLTGIITFGVISIITAVLFGHGNLAVAIYGARPFLLHFPVIFIIGKIFTKEDVLKIGKFTLYLSIPVTVLVVLQFFSPQSAWVNRGVGGDIEGAGFSGALGFSRPPGIFSFTNGNALFYSFTAAFILYFWISSTSINRLILMAATGCLLAAIPLSISRGLFFQVGVSLLFATLAAFRNPKFMGHLFLAAIGIFIGIIVLSHASFFNTAIDAFLSRFTTASDTEGGLKGTLLGRYFGGMLLAFQNSIDQPFFGFGTGMGTNVGSMLLTGSRMFLISEEEWGRLIGELGPLMGLSVIFIRLMLSAIIAIAAYKKLVSGDLLPWMLLSFGLTNIPQASWAQPTSLGFFTIIAGLLLASLQNSKK